MARAKTVGYIVTGSHSPMGLGTTKDQCTTLFFGTAVTVFESRRRAQRAINATLRERPTFVKEFGRLFIQRCVEDQSK